MIRRGAAGSPTNDQIFVFRLGDERTVERLAVVPDLEDTEYMEPADGLALGDEIVIAGAFGTYLDPFKAVRIGLLPNVPLTRIHTNGNAAGAGARMMLASTEARRRATRLAGRIEYLELAVYPGFNKYFAQGVRLPTF